MELSSPKIKKVSYIFSKRLFLYFGKWNFLNFRTELSSTKIKKKPTLKKFLISWEKSLFS